MKLTDLRPAEGATHRKKRVGRGHGSGHGKTSTRGANGQGQRSGESIKIGFEGGQMPLYRRTPKKHAFVRPMRYLSEFAIVNVGDLNRFEDGATVDAQALVDMGLIRREYDGVRVLGDGELKVKLTVKAVYFTASAREKIEAAGGSVEVLG
ncbi:MAG: 50S ribosomal protein L15 [bacterium]|jgi:large subunit ribosomal protein L15|nr:50S ribosomal protein L15 [bacterium]